MITFRHVGFTAKRASQQFRRTKPARSVKRTVERPPLAWVHLRVARATGQKVEFTEPGKILFPAAKFTRAEVINYYLKAAPYLLPHFQGRPCAVKRFPSGVHGEGFWEKDLPGYAPSWLSHTFVPRKDPSEPAIKYAVVDNAEVLAWLCNNDTIELHPFLHRAGDLNTPNFVAIDLDPGEGGNEGTLRAIEVALLVRDFLDQLGLKSWPKVSGSKGVQLYVPLNVQVTYATTQAFAKSMAELLERKHPNLVVSKIAKELRAGKVFIDWSQNMPHKTTVGPYSMRAKHKHPTISLPVDWDELREASKKKETEHLLWSPEAALARLEEVGDLWAPVLTAEQALPAEFMRLGETAAEPPKKAPRAKSPSRALPRRSGQGSRRRFVIHSDGTGELHLRLEIGDTLRSWKVPTIPTAARSSKKVVEERTRPLEFVHFEGVNTEEADTPVMIFDHGTFDTVRGSYDAGAVVVYLNGKKLSGEWSITRKGEAWTLSKTGSSAKPLPLAERTRSALSGRNIDEIGDARDALWPPEPKQAKRTRRTKQRARQ